MVDLDVQLVNGENEYSTLYGSQYTTINFLRWFLQVKAGVVDCARLVDLYMDEFLHFKWFPTPPEVYPGSIEVLRRLKKEGVKTALLRNCSMHAAGQRKLLSHYGWDDLFDVIICGWEVEPTTQDYAHRLVVKELDMASLQEEHPEQFLFVGNDTDVDIVGGNRMGWRTCLLTTTEPTSRGLATHECSSWMQLANQVIWPRKFVKGPSDAFEDSLKAVTDRDDSDINPFIHAVAGHRWQEGKQGFLKGGDKVYKPVQGEGKGSREADFYQVVAEMGAQHFPYVAKFFGVRNFVVNSAVPKVSPDAVPIRKVILPHLVLEDVTAPFDEPSVLDVKIGLTTYDPDCPDTEKIASQRRKYPHQHEMGYSVAGMRVYQPHSRTYEERHREWGRSLQRRNAHLVFETFFWNGERFALDSAMDTLEELRRVRSWMENQKTHRFYSSSLLIIYEGKEDEGGGAAGSVIDDDETTEEHSGVVVKMIDFPHVVPAKEPGGVDQNYLAGLALLISDLKSFIKKEKEKQKKKVRVSHHVVQIKSKLECRKCCELFGIKVWHHCG